MKFILFSVLMALSFSLSASQYGYIEECIVERMDTSEHSKYFHVSAIVELAGVPLPNRWQIYHNKQYKRVIQEMHNIMYACVPANHSVTKSDEKFKGLMTNVFRRLSA